MVEETWNAQPLRLTPGPYLEVPYHLLPDRLGVANQDRCLVVAVPDARVSTMGRVTYQDLVAGPRDGQPDLSCHEPKLAKVFHTDNEVGWEDKA